jgi:repressor LexA
MPVLHEYSALLVRVKVEAQAMVPKAEKRRTTACHPEESKGEPSLLPFQQAYRMILEKMFQCAQAQLSLWQTGKKGAEMKRKPEDSLQQRVYAFLVAFLREQGMPPTIREIGRAVGVESTGHIDHILRMLERQGLIERQKGKSRGIKLTRSTGVPVIGAIAAGTPIDVFEQTSQEPLEVLPLTQEVQSANAFALVVRGQSMIEECICDGDYVIIRPQRTCENGDIVVATHLQGGAYGSATLKRFFQEQDQVRLQPANTEVVPILIPKNIWDQEWEIQGKVVAILRPC